MTGTLWKLSGKELYSDCEMGICVHVSLKDLPLVCASLSIYFQDKFCLGKCVSRGFKAKSFL